MLGSRPRSRAARARPSDREPLHGRHGIRIGNPASWKGAEDAISESSGAVNIVTDEEILAAQSLLATSEGIYCEPASAASVAGLLKFGAPEGSKVVCILTGHGLKDPDITIKSVPKPPVVDADTPRSAARLGSSGSVEIAEFRWSSRNAGDIDPLLQACSS